MDNMKSTITERGDYWHPDPEKDKKLGGPGANQRAREDRAAASKPKSDPKKRKSGESYMDYAKRHGYKKSTPKKKSLLSKLLRKEAYRVLAKDKGEEGKPSQFSYKDEKDANKFADSIKKKGGKATVTKEHHQKDKDGKVIEHGDGTPSSVEEEVLNERQKTNQGERQSEASGRSDYSKASIRNKRKFGKAGEPAVFDLPFSGGPSERGKMITQRRAEHKARRGVKTKGVTTEGVGDAIRAGVKRHKDAVEKKKVKNRKAVPYAALAAQYKPEGQMIEGKGYQPEIEHSKLGDAKKKADKKKESKLPPHLQGDAIAKMKKAFAHTNESVDLTEEWIDSAVEIASDYFFSEGINEEGLDQIIDEVGLEDFVDFVIDPIEELNEERAARKASAKAPSYAKVKAKVDAGDAARKKAGKGEYADTAAAKRNYGDEEAPEGKTAKKKAVAKVTVRKPKAAPKKKAATAKKVEKAVKTAKKTQPTKPTSKKGLLGRVGDAVKKGVERHNKARAAGKVPEKRVKEFAKGFKKGVSGTVKFAGKVKKAVTNEERVEESLKQARKNVGMDPDKPSCWKGYKATGTKMKGGKKVPDCKKEEVEVVDEAERKLADRLARKRKVYDKTTKKAMKFARDEGEASGHARYRMSSISREMDGIKAKMKKEEVLVVDEGIGDMAIKAIEKTNPPHISKRSDMMRKIKLKQLKSYLKKQDEKKKKAASKD